MASPNITAKLLAELKSTSSDEVFKWPSDLELEEISFQDNQSKSKSSHKISSNQLKGLLAEALVCKYLKSKSWQLLFHREKMVHGEVDLVFENEKKVVFIEVKTLHNDWMSFERVSKKQIQRLKLNLLHYKTHKEKVFTIAFVSSQGQIKFVID